jgi:hypothetical protein
MNEPYEPETENYPIKEDMTFELDYESPEKEPPISLETNEDDKKLIFHINSPDFSSSRRLLSKKSHHQRQPSPFRNSNDLNHNTSSFTINLTTMNDADSKIGFLSDRHNPHFIARRIDFETEREELNKSSFATKLPDSSEKPDILTASTVLNHRLARMEELVPWRYRAQENWAKAKALMKVRRAYMWYIE